MFVMPRNEASPIIILNKGRRFLRQRDKLRRKCHSENILRKNEQAIYLNATYFVFVMPTCSVSIGRNEASPIIILINGVASFVDVRSSAEKLNYSL